MIEGTLDHLHLGDLLQWLQMGGLSGRLTLIDHGFERRLDFLEGRVVFASSQLPQERLASWLAREGVLDPRSLRRLLGRSLLRRALFTDILIDEGRVEARAVRDSLARLAETIATRILLAPSVRFVLDPSFPVRDLLGLDLNLEPNALLMEAARRSDEERHDRSPGDDQLLPYSGDAFDQFFWRVIREGVSGGELLEGEQIIDLHGTVRSIMATLAQWLASSPGLVPMPEGQVREVLSELDRGGPVHLAGRPHAVWNQMVLACAIRSHDLPTPRTLSHLQKEADDLELWPELTTGEGWHRPDSGRLDELTAGAVRQWTRAAAAAAPHFDLEPDSASLAVHLLAVPSDLVLWVLASLPVPHQKLRLALLRRIPQRLGTALVRQADFPADFRPLMEPGRPGPLNLCLHIARDTLVSGPLWPETVPAHCEADYGRPKVLRAARAAARKAVESDSR